MILLLVVLKVLRMLINVIHFVLHSEGQTVCTVCNREQVVKFVTAISTITFLNAKEVQRF